MIVTNKQILRMKSNPVIGVTEAKKILDALDRELNNTPNGIGLAAIQINIPFKIALIKWKNKRIELINPAIIEKEDEFIHTSESCLSLPGKLYNVKRYKQIVISNNIIDGNYFRAENEIFYYDETNKNPDITTIAVQHEIDHMNGILIEDIGSRTKPIISNKKIGRNEPCMCGSGKKYKKCCGR